MNPTRREFMKDMVIVGTVVTAGSVNTESSASPDRGRSSDENNRCPYFDQPMYCKGLSNNGVPFCNHESA